MILIVGINEFDTRFFLANSDVALRLRPHETDRLHYLLHYYRLTHVARAGPFSLIHDLDKARAGSLCPKETRV